MFRLATLSICLFLALAAAPPARAAQDGVTTTLLEGELQRLAEILGALHYLRGICGNNEGNKWRSEMQALLDLADKGISELLALQQAALAQAV